MSMTSSKPYLIRAIYEWLIDNQLTPYIVVDTTFPNVMVPERFIEDNKIILNISPDATAELMLGNEVVEFDASFSGKTLHIYAPVKAIVAIYAFENGRGMMFQGGEEDDEGGPGPEGGEPKPQPPKKGKPMLKVVK